MADVKISALPTTTSASTGDYIPVVEGDVTKKVQAGPGGGLDADTVSGYGIGTDVAPLANGYDLDGLTKTGFYSVFNPASSGSTFPEAENKFFYVLNFSSGATYTYQEIVNLSGATGAKYHRTEINGTWSAWYKDWTAENDGNGGQPPAPKPTEGTPAGGANTQGKYIVESKTSGTGAVYYSGFSNLTGTWILDCLVTVTSTGAVVLRMAGVGAGTFAVATDTNYTYALTAWRVA